MKSGMKDTLLLIGDENSDRAELHTIFESRYYLLEAENIAQGTFLLQQNSVCIAAVIADIPLTNEAAVRTLVKTANPHGENELPILFLVTPDENGQHEETAFRLGASDVVLKPYAELSIQKRVQVLVDLYLHRWHLEYLVEEQNQTIRNSYQTILDTMSSIIERRNVDSGNHVQRVRGFAKIMLQEMAKCYPEYNLTPERIEIISAATSLHDIGKIIIPDAILNKPGPLTPEEFDIIKEHTTQGSELIAKLSGTKETDYLHYAYNICLYHHERWDGKGYPKGLKGDEIPLCAQVAGVADAFDALTSQRVYKSAMPYKTAVNMILNGECGTFSPKLLESLKRCYQGLIDLADQYSDEQESMDPNIRKPLPALKQISYALDAAQISQLKYQTLLHYINDTIIEIDIDTQVYHVVHNPHADFVGNANKQNTFHRDHLKNFVLSGVHPEDAVMMIQQQKLLAEQLYTEKQRKATLQCRLYNPPFNRYDNYQITLLRINVPNPNQRAVLAVFHNMDMESNSAPVKSSSKALLTESTLFELAGAAICCKVDKHLTIVDKNSILTKLTGYTSAQLQEVSQGYLINLVHPLDRELMRTMVRNAEDGASRQEEQFRLLRKDDTPIWVLGRCRLQTGFNGNSYLFFYLTDITELYESHQTVIHNYVRSQEIFEQFKHIVIVWDLQTDEFTCSKQWEDRFGYRLEQQKLSYILDGWSHIHPDDVAQLRRKAIQLRQKEGKDFIDLRIADKDGRYYWNRIRAISKAEGQENPTCIIAVIYDIDDLKHDVLTMKQKAEQDMLTRLLNKASTQQAVEDYLERRSSDTLAAMLIMDMDNFKAVNDTFGHLYGDAVLTQIGATLQNIFRSKDILGRIGGDEFLILMKDLPNTDIAYDRCAQLVKTFRETLSKLMPQILVSVSVGCAIIPEHGSNWSELFLHADEALYNAKNSGKCQYQVYNPTTESLPSADSIDHTTIDSDDVISSNHDTLVHHVFRTLYSSQDLDTTITEVLTFVGTYFGVSRVYIFENNPENTHCDNTFEWCNAGILPQIENLQGVSYDQDVPSWKSMFNQQGVFYSTDILSLPPDLRDILEPQGIKSLLHCAIMDQGVFRGVVGFDECNSNCLWTKEQISLLQFLAEVLSVFLLKRRKAGQGTTQP